MIEDDLRQNEDGTIWLPRDKYKIRGNVKYLVSEYTEVSFLELKCKPVWMKPIPESHEMYDEWGPEGRIECRKDDPLAEPWWRVE